MSRKIELRDFKPIEFEGFKYFKAVYNLFGLKEALIQLSPLLNLIFNYSEFRE